LLNSIPLSLSQTLQFHFHSHLKQTQLEIISIFFHLDCNLHHLCMLWMLFNSLLSFPTCWFSFRHDRNKLWKVVKMRVKDWK
jgi:hypothetical protein